MTRSGLLLAVLTLLVPAAREEPRVIDLAGAAWTCNGRAPDVPPTVLLEPPEARLSDLAFEKMGTRWACEFETQAGETYRLALRWRGAPDGMLFEIVLDGQRLSPPRDGWRPTARDLRSDLGSVWLGPGAHLLEFVAREKPPEPPAHLRVAALELGKP